MLPNDFLFQSKISFKVKLLRAPVMNDLNVPEERSCWGRLRPPEFPVQDGRGEDRVLPVVFVESLKRHLLDSRLQQQTNSNALVGQTIQFLGQVKGGSIVTIVSKQ